MRLFVAVDVSDAIRSYAQWVRSVVCRVAPTLQRDLRWVEPRQMHVTLRFLGEVDAADADRLGLAFAEPMQEAPFEVELAEPRWLPTTARPRVLVVGFRRGADELRALHDTVELRIRASLPIEPEERAFLPHLTLARARDPRRMRPVDLARAVTARNEGPMPSARIEHVTLYQSQLSPQGPTYVALASAALAGMP